MAEVSLKKINEFIKSKDVQGLKEYMKEFDLVIENGKIVPKNRKLFKEKVTFWDQRQHARKILLNSLYGALLNEGSRFYDQRIGQSTTLTGRSVVKHMNSKLNEIILGEYKIGESICYIDTDSAYFTVEKLAEKNPEIREILNDRDATIALYDQIADEVNDSFPEFMNKTFHTGIENGKVIKAGKELVASKGLFITKKRYALLCYEYDGLRYDKNNEPGKIKAMGLDLKRADTPKMMQEFLEKVLLCVLDGGNREDVIDMIIEFRKSFRDLDGWQKGTPKKVNGLSDYSNRLDDFETQDMFKDSKKKVNMPGHVRAAINWNRLKQINHDRYSLDITDGQKVIVCKLKPNPLKMDSVAYPIDQNHLPSWFKELPFDDETMESTIIDKKLENLIGILQWDLRDARQDSTFNDLFSF